MEDFKQYLSEGAEAAERDAAKQVLDGLAGMRLENKVAEVAAERRAWLRRRFWGRMFLVAAALVIIAGVAFMVFREKDPAVEQNPSEQPTIQQPIANENQPGVSPQTPPKERPEKKENGPIAQNNGGDQLPSPRFSSPNVRGQNNEDKAWKAQLDKLWYTQYPVVDLRLSETFDKADQSLRARDFTTAYVQLQRLEKKLPENDTLRLLKGYCLMEMGEGAEALTYFEKLKGTTPEWEMTLEWYRGLSSLLTGDKEKALAIFSSIAAKPQHLYHKQSNKAIKVLK